MLAGTGNIYTGGTFINAGTLSVAADGSLGALAGGVTIDGAKLSVAGGFTSARTITLNAGGGTLDTTGPSATFSGTITGPGRLTRAGSTGSIILTGNNTYAGGTTIASGILQIGNGGATGSIFGDVVNNGSLIFARSDVYTFAGNISGAGSVTVQGGGVATLTGNNSFTERFTGSRGGRPACDGSTLVAEPTAIWAARRAMIVLEQGSGLRFANSFEITRSILLDGTAPVTIDTQDNIVTASGVVSGTVALAKDGIGTLILTNTNSQTGGAEINAGTLQIGGGAATGTLNGDVTVAPGARLVFDRADAMTFGATSGAGGRIDIRQCDQRGRLRCANRHGHADRCWISHLSGRNHSSRGEGCWSTVRSLGLSTWRAAPGWAALAASAGGYHRRWRLI